MDRLLKIFRIYSLVFIAFGIISFGFSAVSDILGAINENIQYDVMSSAEMLPFINGGVFIIIGGLLQTFAGIYGFRSADDPSIIFRPIVLSIIAISWQITGFIILFSSHILNIRLFLQVPMTFIFLVLAFLVHYKTTEGIKKKHLELSSLVDIATVDRMVQKKDIASIFQSMASSRRSVRRIHIPMPSFRSGKRIKRINIKPIRKFKR